MIIRLSIKQFLNAETHIGKLTNQRNVNNTKHLIAKKKNIDLINIQKTIQHLEPVLYTITEAIANYETILFIAQHPTAFLKKMPQPFLTTQWIHGGLSNYKTLQKSKKQHFFKTLKRIPNLIFILQSQSSHIIINETKYLEIPIFALRNTSENPKHILYPIPSNNNTDTTLSLYISLFTQACYYGYAKNILAFTKN